MSPEEIWNLKAKTAGIDRDYDLKAASARPEHFNLFIRRERSEINGDDKRGRLKHGVEMRSARPNREGNSATNNHRRATKSNSNDA